MITPLTATRGRTCTGPTVPPALGPGDEFNNSKECPADVHGAKRERATELRYYTPETWFTAEGARLKAWRLQRAGIPDMSNWRFITLTIANRKISALEAYLLGKDRIRRFLAKFRAAIGRDFLWCWKLEFHEDGYAHWHLLIQYTNRIPEDMMPKIEGWWGLGRVNIKHVKDREMAYVFKYVAKGLEELPPWVGNHRGRLRVFQTSKGFFVRARKRVAKKQEPRTCLVPLTLGQKLDWDGRKALHCEKTPHGEVQYSIVKLRIKFSDLYMARIHQSISRRQSLAGFGIVPISASQSMELKYEHRKFSGLGRIPRNAAFAA